MCQKIAEHFASALDREDFPAAAKLLDAQVVYYFGSECITGRDRVIAAYRDHSIRARKVFDRIIYSHSLEATEHRQFLITFIDAIRHRGRPFAHKCRQKIAFNRADLIDLIIHHDLPGEKDKLDTYMREMDD
ncbi:MAG: hypothetical protein ACYTFG_20385 [Planctomycetota bacterium]|jgi:hypothetical protein